MPNANEQLEQELRAIWQQAANTRKATSSQRIERILKRSRAELSLRDLFKFAGFCAIIHGGGGNHGWQTHCYSLSIGEVFA